MAYVKDKAFTDHPLMDEICFNCKRILKGIVIKNDVLALMKETEKSIENAEMYSIYLRYKTIPFEYYQFNEELLYAFGYNKFEVKAALRDRNSIPEADREGLTIFANQWFLDHYFEDDGRFKEENDYYRMLIGLPPYETGDEYYIYLKKSDIPSTYEKEVDLSLPLHKQDRHLINVLYANGTIDKFRKQYLGSNYSYILYLGDRSIDWLKARQANKWDILYIPTVHELVRNKFIEFYRINRDIYANWSYQEFYADTGEYYDQMMILIVLCETFNNLITDTPQWYIRRDIFDLRSCQYFMESNGVEFFKIIPLKYQVRIVKNLNRLITYKSSNKNAMDILDIFDIDNTKIFKYWLYKKKLSSISEEEDNDNNTNTDEPVPPSTDEEKDEDLDFGDLLEGKSPTSIVGEEEDWDYNVLAYYDEEESKNTNITEEDRDNTVNIKDKAYNSYELQFIASEIHESYDDYIKESRYITPYDDITLQDKFWDGDLDHEFVKNEILKKEFTIVGTKYMSIEYEVDLQKFQYQMSYLLGLIISSNLDTSDLVVGVPSIDEFAHFTISDLFLFLVALTNNYSIIDGRSATEIELFDLWKGAPPEICEKLYDWKKKYFPEFWIKKDGRVLGFNPKVKMDELIEVLERRHSHFRFGLGDEENAIPLVGEQYKERADEWIKELGVFDYTVPNYSISTIDDLVYLYTNNTNCYNTLYTALSEASDHDDKKYIEYIFQELYTRDFDIDYYTDSKSGKSYTNLVDIIKDHNYILYSAYYKIMQETNIESRQDTIRSVMNDVITTLEYYLSAEGMEYLFAFTSNESFSSIIYYIYLMINFFKSYKVYFLDPYVTFSASDKNENNAKVIDRISEWKYEYSKWDRAFVSDVISGMNVQLNIKDSYPADLFAEQVDIYAHHEPNLFMDYDYNGFTEDESVNREDVNGGTADDSKIAPYIMVNGGKSYQKNIDLSNIDGGEANIYNREYYDINGGEALHKDDTKTDMFGSQKFNYMIDGGCANGRRFISNTLDLQLIGTELFGNVIISPRTKFIEILEDGLYINPDNFASATQFNNLVNTVNYLINLILVTGADTAEDLKVMTNIKLFEERVQNIVDSTTYNMEYVVDNLINSNKFVDDLKKFIDNTNSALVDEFEDKLNPYIWEEL